MLCCPLLSKAPLTLLLVWPRLFDAMSSIACCERFRYIKSCSHTHVVVVQKPKKKKKKHAQLWWRRAYWLEGGWRTRVVKQGRKSQYRTAGRSTSLRCLSHSLSLSFAPWLVWRNELRDASKHGRRVAWWMSALPALIWHVNKRSTKKKKSAHDERVWWLLIKAS